MRTNVFYQHSPDAGRWVTGADPGMNTDYPRDAVAIVTPQEFLAMDFMDKST